MLTLEKVLAGEGLLDRAALGLARERAIGEGKSLIAVLADQGIIPEDVLAEALARAVHTLVVDVELGTVDPDAAHLLAEDLARQHLVLLVSADHAGGSAQVVFADPTDKAARRVAEEATKLKVRPLVATVSSIRNAIAREYEKHTRELPSLATRYELPSEVTRRVDSVAYLQHDGETASIPGTHTHPVHRMELRTPVEKRHEALVLALIEAGVITRADYAAALRRLAGSDIE